MRDSSRRARDHQGFRLEVLEDRNLLSHSGAYPFASFLPRPVHPALPQAAVIQGQIHANRAPDGLYYGPPPGEVSFSGSGSAHPGHIGVVLFGTNFAETPNSTGTAIAITNGNAVLRGLYGEQINVDYAGVVQTPARRRHTITLSGVIASGTGRFLGASGSFHATGVMTASNQFSLKFTLVPVYATP